MPVKTRPEVGDLGPHLFPLVLLLPEICIPSHSLCYFLTPHLGGPTFHLRLYFVCVCGGGAEVPAT